MPRTRLLLACALFVSVLFGPWWLTLIISITLAARYRAWEVIAAGILMDLLWLPVSDSFSLLSVPWGAIIAIILVFGLEPLRRQLLTGPEIL